MPPEKKPLEKKELWHTIGQLCLLASMENQLWESDPATLKKMNRLFEDIGEQTDQFFDKYARMYFRYAVFERVVPIVAEIYKGVERGTINKSMQEKLLLLEVRRAVHRYLGYQLKIEEADRITDEKIIRHLMTDALTIRGFRGPVGTAVKLVGNMLGVQDRTSEKLAAQAKKVEVRSDDDPDWDLQPYTLLDEILTNMFDAKAEQVHAVLRVFGLDDET